MKKRLDGKLAKVTSSYAKICSDKKPCCIHKCCNAQTDEQCCSTCEPLSQMVDWSNGRGFHIVE